MGRIALAIHSSAPPAAVWSVLDDPSRNPEWQRSVAASIEGATRPLVPGATFRERVRVLGPLTRTVSWRVTALHHARLHEHGGAAPVTGETTVRFTLDPHDGGCIVAVEARYAFGETGLAALLDRLLIRPAARRAFQADLRRLCALAEAGLDT